MSGKLFIGAVMVFVIAALAFSIGINAYSAPENKLSRQLDLGQKYLESGWYEEAILAFENAISIDEKCMEAYIGGIEAYLMMDDREALAAFYDRALSAVRDLDDEALKTKTAFVEEIYLSAGRVYGDDLEKKRGILEEGWSVITGSTKIKVLV